MANMNMSMSKYLVKFMHRTASNTSDKRIADAFNKGANFDVDLITSDDKKVSAHRFVLALYSKYLATQIHDAAFNGVLIILLKDLPFEVVQKIVQLLYFREVTVHQDLSIEMKDALKFLKIDDTNIAAAESDQFKVPNVPQRKMIATKQVGVPPIQQLQQQQQQQPNVVRREHVATAEQTGSYVAGKRKRAQSTFVSSTPRDPDMFVAAKAPNCVGNPNVSAMNIARNISGLNITKVARSQPQPQPPKVNSLSMTRSPSPVNQSNVGLMVETPGKVTTHPTTPNQSPIAKQNNLPNGNIGRNIPGLNITKVARSQPQPQPQPTKINLLPTRSPSPVNQSNVCSMVETPEKVTSHPTSPNQSPIANRNSLSNGNIGRNIPGLNITKVARSQPQPQPQPQPPKVNSLSMTRSPSPVNQSNVGSMVETPEITSRPSTPNPSPIAKQNGLPNGTMLQSVEKKSTPPIVQQQQQQQQQQQVRPTQPPTIPNMPASITIHKVNAIPEKSVNIQEMVPLADQFSSISNDDNLNQDGENDEISDEMEINDSQYEEPYEDEPMEGDEEEEEKECDVNGNFAQTDLRDIFPELR